MKKSENNIGKLQEVITKTLNERMGENSDTFFSKEAIREEISESVKKKEQIEEKTLNESPSVTSSSEEFMDKFIEKLKNGTLKKEQEPLNGPPFIPTEEVISLELERYSKLLKSDLVDGIVEPKRGYVLQKRKKDN